MDQAGLVLLAVTGLWIAYLVPHRLRTRQELLEARVEDRFSDGLRVLRVAHASVGPGTVRSGTRRTSHRPADRTHVLIHPGGQRGGGAIMNRPHAARDRVVADAVRWTAAQHARRAAHLARRRAAARRRALLTLVLLVATVGGWAGVGLVSAPVLVGLVPAVGLLGVLALGRRAVVSAARADAEWIAGAADRVPLPGLRSGPRVTGRAVHPSDAETEVMARVRPAERRTRPGPAQQPAVARTTEVRAEGPGAVATPASSGTAADTTGTGGAADAVPSADEPSWVPVPVPRPTYTLKPSAPRREPAPLPAEGLAVPAAPSATATEDEAPSSSPAAGRAGQTMSTPPTPSLDLDAILARRRAAGE